MTTRSRKGMALLMVLFIVMAIAIISSGFIARSDTELLCGRNFSLRNEANYAALGGLEIAWAYVHDPNGVIPISRSGESANWGAASGNLKYDLAIDNDTGVVSDPNVYVYPVTCEAYQWVDDEKRAVSHFYGDLLYDANTGQAHYISIRREE